MRRLVISLDPMVQKFKGHRAALLHICKDIALYNGGNYGDPNKKKSPEADKYIKELFAECNAAESYSAGLNLVQVDECTFRFGHQKSKEAGGYVTYGTITKIVTLN